MRSHVFLLSSLLIFSVLPKTSVAARTLAPAQQRVYEEAMLDAFVRSVNNEVKTGSDLARIFAFRNKKAQGPWAELAAKVTEVPRLTREGRDVVMHYPAGDVRFTMKDFSRTQIALGSLTWAFDTSAPVKLQFELLEAKLRRLATKSSGDVAFTWPALWPEAHAQTKEVAKGAVGKVLEKVCNGNCSSVSFLLTAWGIFSGKLPDLVGDYLCYGFYSADWQTPFNAGRCLEWRDAHETREKKKREKSMANWGAMKGKIEWAYDENPKCSGKDGKGNEVYSFAMQEVVPGKQISDSAFFVGKGTRGLLKDAAIYANEADSKAPDAAQRALVQFIFTEEPSQTEAGVPPTLTYVRMLDPKNKQLSANESNHIMVDMAKQPSAVPTRIADQVFRAVDQIANAQQWVNFCRTAARASKINREGVAKAVDNAAGQPKPEDSAK